MLPLSMQQQSTELDSCEVVSVVTSIVDVLFDERANAETVFQGIFVKVNVICNKLDVPDVQRGKTSR
jgi:hypothetical protein